MKEKDWGEPQEKEICRSKSRGDGQTDTFRWLDPRLIPGDRLRMRVKV